MEERKGTETRRAYIRNLIWFRSGHEAVSSFRSTYFFFYLPARCLFAISSGFSLLQHHRYSSVLWIGTVMALFTNCFPSSVITLSICGLICNHVWPVPPSSPPSSSLPPPVSFLSLFVSSASSTFRPFNLTGFSPNENFLPSSFPRTNPFHALPRAYSLLACIQYEILFVHQITFRDTNLRH